MPRRAPKSEPKFMTLCRWLVRKWDMVSPGEIGLTSQQVGGFEELYEEAATAIAEVRAAEEALRRALDRKHRVVAELRGRFGGLASIIDGFAATSAQRADVYSKAGLKPPTRPRRRAGAPEAPAGIATRVRSDGAVELAIDAKTDGRVLEVQRATLELREQGGHPAVAFGPWTSLERAAGGKRVIDRTVPRGLAGVAYRVRVVTTTGLASEWSQLGTVSFGYDGAEDASVAAAPVRAA
jgi:hypothetical protein